MSSGNIAVSARDLSKAYSIAHNAEKHTTAAEALVHRLKNPFQRQEKETFWALKDVEFDIKKGDVVGIIGRNGAGKSTLLKILSRITEPTTGSIALYGRVGSLLEVGTGFHPELTGRENIFLNGAILGMKKSEITRQFDAIVDFAGVEQFIDTPVKRYSSGMYVRLAFAVAAHLNPEILIVDEVLAVGDAEFQRKCMGKMKDVANTGRTVLFVSHNMAAIMNLCNSCIILRQGQLCYYGDTQTSVQAYLSSGNSVFQASESINNYRPAWAKPYIRSVRAVGENGQEQTRFPLGSDISIEMSFVSDNIPPLRSPVMGIVVNHTIFGTAGGVNTRMTNFELDGGPFKEATIRCTLQQPSYLQGRYTVDVWLGDGMIDVDMLSGCIVFEIEDSDVYGTGKIPFADMGITFLKPCWKLIDASC